MRAFLEKQDRFLWSILIGVGLLAVCALSVFWLRLDQDYGAEDTPQGVVRNYVLALQNYEYRQAYAYVAQGTSTPDFSEFQSELVQNAGQRPAVQIGEARQTGNTAVVAVTLLHASNGIFDPDVRENHQAELEQDSRGAWKIVKMPNPYWGWGW